MEKSINFKIKLIISILCIFATTLGVVFFCFNNFNKEENIQSVNAVTISSAPDLAGISNMNGTYYITKDIDLSGYNWTPIGTMENPFTGKLIGNKGGGEYNQTNKVVTIKNLTINLSESIVKAYRQKADLRFSPNVSCTSQYGSSGSCYRYDGFFGIVNGATIQNIRFENVTYNLYCINESDGSAIQANSNLTRVFFGTVCGRAYGETTIENCEVKNLNVTVKLVGGSINNIGFFISGIVGETHNITGEYINVYNNNGYGSSPLKNTSGAKLSIKNVVVSGDISVVNDGTQATSDLGSFTFYGIGSYVYSSKESISIDNACFLPKNETFWNQQGRWKTNWSKNYYKITGNPANMTNCCTSASEINNLNVCCIDSSGSNAKHNPKHTFFYDSTIRYKGNGEYESTAYGDSAPILINSVENSVEHTVRIINNYDGISTVSYNSDYLYRRDDNNFKRWAPCSLICSGLNTTKIELGNANVEIALKSGFETAGWQLERNNYYMITIVPSEVNLKFDLPIGFSGVEFNTTSSTVYTVLYVAEITVQYTQLEDYSYQLQFIFTEKNGTTQTITYTIPKQYISTEFEVGKSSVIEVKKEINSSTGLTLTITPQLRLKTYGFEFT